MHRIDEEARGQSHCPQHRSKGIWVGLLITLIGVGLLLRKMDVDFLPHWLFTWPMLLIIWGLFIGIRHRFRDFLSVILIVVGGALIVRDAFDIPFDLQPYLWPIAIIVIGVVLMVKPKRHHNWKKPGHRWRMSHSTHVSESISDNEMDTTAVFCGTRKTVISKDFKGGEIVTVFGGTEINMMQADINGQVVLDVVTVFGGLKLIVPSHWEVRSNLVTIAGGVDDKRSTPHSTTENPKVLILEGTVILGGVDVKSY